MAFAPDGQAVATGDGDHTIRLWNPHAETTPARSLWTLALGHAPDGWLLAACTDEQTEWISKAATGTQDAVGVGGLDSGSTAAFSPDGRLLATAVGRSIRLSDTASGTRVPQQVGTRAAENLG